MDNPFAVPPRRVPAYKSLKVLVGVIACLAGVLTFQSGSQRWLLSRLTSDWDNLPASVQRERLSQIAQLEPGGTLFLVQQLGSMHPGVAQASFDLLQQLQQDWLALDDDASDARHRRLAESLAACYGTDQSIVENASNQSIPSDRENWLTMLLNRTIVETVERSTTDGTAAYRTATSLLTNLTLPTQRPSGPSSNALSTPQIALRTEPLPAAPSIASASDANAESAAAVQTEQRTEQPSEPMPLQEANASTTATLRAPQATMVTEQTTLHQVVAPVQHLTQHLGDSPFETYSTRSVIAWLRSVRPQMRDSAHHELKKRGFDEPHLLLAARLADPDIRVRLALLNELAHHPGDDPRQWLFWLSEDAEPQVRREAISILGTMDDPQVTQFLHQRLPIEQDAATVDIIRRVLRGA